MLTVIVTITGGLYAVLRVIMAKTERSVYSVNSYFENNGEVYMQC